MNRNNHFENINPSVLIAEDESIIAMDVKFILESVGYHICGIVSTGEDSIKKASDIQPDLVLMDIKLKGNIDGIYAGEKIYSDYNIPIVYITAYSDKSLAGKLSKKKGNAYIIKPFEEEEVKQKIKKALNNHKRVHA